MYSSNGAVRGNYRAYMDTQVIDARGITPTQAKLDRIDAMTGYRAIAALQRLPTFYEAFGIKEGDPIWLPPEERITAW